MIESLESTAATSAAKVLVHTEGLTKIYGDGHKVRALDDASIQIAAGEFVAVMGPSGCGKSTLLNLLGALDRPTSGWVAIDGQRLDQVRNLDRFRARTVGFVFQLHNLVPTLTARENVEVPMMGHVRLGLRRRARAAELLELVGLADRMNHLPNALSGGQRQKVAIARALANEPALLLADEPTGNLDSSAGSDVLSVFSRLNRERGTTILMVTHDSTIARRASRVFEMHDGRVVREQIVGSAFEEDLRAFRRSELGRAVLNGEQVDLTKKERELLKKMLARVE